MRSFFRSSVVALFTLVMCMPSLAQHPVCGTAPEWDIKSENQEKLKGDLQGKAQALSKYIGSADLSGQIQTERQTIYKTTDQSEARRQDAYLAFMFCVLIMDDKTLSTGDKLKAISEFKQPAPPAKKVNEDDVAAKKLRSALQHNGLGNALVGDTLAPRTDNASMETVNNQFLTGDHAFYIYGTGHNFVWQYVYLNQFGNIEAMKFSAMSQTKEFKSLFESVLSELSAAPVYYSRRRIEEAEACNCSGSCKKEKTFAVLSRTFIESEESTIMRFGGTSMKYLKESFQNNLIDEPDKPCKTDSVFASRAAGPEETIWVFKTPK